MKTIYTSLLLLASFNTFANCPDLHGTWKGNCNRDGVEKEEALYIKQSDCREITMYRVQYKIGLPYEQRYENDYEKQINIFNFRWGRDSNSLLFDVDRIKWMKDKNIVSTGEGRGIIKVKGDSMDYYRKYSSRNRQGIYETKTRKCTFTRS